MPRLPKLIPISDLRTDAAAVLKQVRSGNEPLIITQRGRAAAVMVSMEAYEQAAHERELLMQLAHGDQEIRAGHRVELEAVLGEAKRAKARGK